MVVYRINETLQTGAVRNRTYRVGESVYLFSEFTIVEVLRYAGKRRSARLYQQLAQEVGLNGCQDSSFRRFREILQEWFSA